MIQFRGFSIATLLLLTLITLGCGPGEPTVIERTEDYQLTEAEEANKQAEMEARKNAGG